MSFLGANKHGKHSLILKKKKKSKNQTFYTMFNQKLKTIQFQFFVIKTFMPLTKKLMFTYIYIHQLHIY
jgi:hypothetical protein